VVNRNEAKQGSLGTPCNDVAENLLCTIWCKPVRRASISG